MPTLQFVYPPFPGQKRRSNQPQFLGNDPVSQSDSLPANPNPGADVGKTGLDIPKTAQNQPLEAKTATDRIYSSRPKVEISRANLTPDIQKLLSGTDDLLIRHAHWLNQAIQPVGYKIAPPPAVSPLTSYGDTTRLQEAVRTGRVNGFSESFLSTLETVQALQGQSVNETRIIERERLRQQHQTMLRSVVKKSVLSGANKYELFTATCQEFAATRTQPLDKREIRTVFQEAGAPIGRIGLAWWRFRQSVLKRWARLLGITS